MKIEVATIVLSILSLGAAEDKRRKYPTFGRPENTKVARLECASSYPDTFTTHIALTTKNNKDDLGDSLRDAYRIGTATECDPFQRSLKGADQIGDEKSADDKYTSLELYEVTVVSYGQPDPQTALEEFDDFYPVINKQKKGIFCTLDAITSNNVYNGRCPRFGCYCPKRLLGSEETTGITEPDLAMLLNEQLFLHERYSGGYSGYGYGGGYGKGGKGGKKGGTTVTVEDVAELRQFPCAIRQVLETRFQFVAGANICTDLTPQQLDVFVREFVRRANLAQFNGCDGAFRRLISSEVITNCQNFNRRNLQFSDVFLNSTFLISSLFEEFSTPERTDEQFSGDVRRRLGEDQPLNIAELHSPSLLSSTFNLFSNNNQTKQRSSIHHALLEEGTTSKSLDFDYGGAFNFKDGMCYCSAFSDKSNTGITQTGLLGIANAAMQFATDGEVEIKDVVELEDDACGLPQVFTERVSIEANGLVGRKYFYDSFDEDGILAGLAELCVKVIKFLSNSFCVSTYLEPLDITLKVYDSTNTTTNEQYSEYDWSLEYDIQYVMFGVTDQEDANLFVDDRRLKRDTGLETATESRKMRHDERLAGEVDYFRLQDLSTVLAETDCSCNPTTDALTLAAINENLQEAIHMAAVPGLYDATMSFSSGITARPTVSPSDVPSASPSTSPSTSPSASPSAVPSALPSQSPSSRPSVSPSTSPSTSPSSSPSDIPSTSPSQTPSTSPSASPTSVPSTSPSQAPSTSPSLSPSTTPSLSPSASPSTSPSVSPSVSPSASPSMSPSANPTISIRPTAKPSTSPRPSARPSLSPSSRPTPEGGASPVSTPAPTDPPVGP